ncbi:MAG: AAA family ATPase [Candidatus Thiodiazotropha sp. (ex Lucinoma kastoroae)]|nr:AAA family ATPase [Candidatus Thiodiazotropha sp. (ex Lucinoma kastoroae)]
MLSQQAKRHFKLFQDPFLDDVLGPEDVFLDSEQRYIREVMYQAAIRSGFLAIIGESGAGKTTLRKDLVERIELEQSPIVLIQPRIIDKGRLTAGAICDAIIQDVSMELPKRTLEDKARQIETLLSGSSRAGNSHVLIIEEAHDLNVSTLKYLKRFWELEDGFRSLMGIILIGQPELKYRLDERTNWDAREVIRRCEVAELKPLDDSLEGYLDLKFKRLGKPMSDILEEDVADALRERLILRRHGSSKMVSMLYPLVVNNAVRKAMNLAAEIGQLKVSAEIVRGI